MKRFICILLIIWLAGCSLDENPIVNPQSPVHASRSIHYIHLAVGDSLGYGWRGVEGYPDPFNIGFYTHDEGITVLDGESYHRVADYPLSDWWPPTILMREDNEGNIHALFFSDSGNVQNTSLSILYKTSAGVGGSWSFFYYPDTLTCTLVSRSDTVETNAGIFRNCLRVRIRYTWYAYEDHVLAPGIGVVMRDFETYTSPPIFMPWIDLKDLRLKSVSRR
jgi:hypothetical protein